MKDAGNTISEIARYVPPDDLLVYVIIIGQFGINVILIIYLSRKIDKLHEIISQSNAYLSVLSELFRKLILGRKAERRGEK